MSQNEIFVSDSPSRKLMTCCVLLEDAGCQLERPKRTSPFSTFKDNFKFYQALGKSLNSIMVKTTDFLSLFWLPLLQIERGETNQKVEQYLLGLLIETFTQVEA